MDNISYINPIRIREAGVGVGLIAFPNYDEMTQRTNYQKGIYAQPDYYPNFIANIPIHLQVHDNVTFASAENLDTGASTFITPVDITPPFWVSGKIYRISYTPPALGLYAINIVASTRSYRTDEFSVKSVIDKDFIRINYYDTQNRNGGVFFNGSTQRWNPEMFYQGMLRKAPTEYERSVYNDEPNNTNVLSNTPKLKETLIITDLHDTYYDNLSYQFSCDNLIVNGISRAVEEFGDPEYVDGKSDIINVTITLSRNQNNGFMKFS